MGGILHGIDVPPRAKVANDFGLVQSDDRVGQAVVIRIVNTTHRRLDSSLF